MSPTFAVEGGRPGEIIEVYRKYSHLPNSQWVAQHGVPDQFAAGGVEPFDTPEEALAWLEGLGTKAGEQLSDEPVTRWWGYTFGDAINKSDK